MIKYLLIPLLTLISLSATAQDFDFFALAGPVASQIDGDNFGGYNKMGLVLGAGVSRDINHSWKAQMELEFIQKGKGSYYEDGSTYKVILNYLQLPIIANYTLIENLSIETGVSFSYLISYQFNENGEDNNSHRPYTPYSYDINWLLGSTYSFSKEWKVNLRFAYSILPMGNTIEEEVYNPNFWRKPGAQYNNSLAVTVQYWF